MMSDWERQRRLDEMERLQREGNRALQESNRIESKKIEVLKEHTRQLEQARWDDECRRMREKEERIEQGFRDRIFNLRTKIAEVSDGYQEAKLQALLTEAIADEERYYEGKRRQEEEARIRAEQLERERLIKEQIAEKLRFRRKVLKIVLTIFQVGLVLFVAFLVWRFWETQNNNSQLSTFNKIERAASTSANSVSASHNQTSSSAQQQTSATASSGAPVRDQGNLINQKNLTTDQVQKWVKADFLRMMARLQKNVILSPKDIRVTVWMADDGLVYADVMLPETVLADLSNWKPALYPPELSYRINEDGELERYERTDIGDPNADGSPGDYEWEFRSDTYEETW